MTRDENTGIRAVLRVAALVLAGSLVGCVRATTVRIATVTPAFATTAIGVAPPSVPIAALPATVVHASPGDVWIDGHWLFRDGQYAWVEGRYIAGRRGLTLVQPSWIATSAGYVYQPAHWEDAHGVIESTVVEPGDTTTHASAATAHGDRVAMAASAHGTGALAPHQTVPFGIASWGGARYGGWRGGVGGGFGGFGSGTSSGTGGLRSGGFSSHFAGSVGTGHFAGR
jgi:hypothetical protein